MLKTNPEIARTNANMIMMIDAAIGRLHDLGYPRSRIDIDASEAVPLWLLLDSKPVFSCDIILKDGRVALNGEWLVDVKKRNWFVRLFYRITARLARRRQKALPGAGAT